jgi:hypothetical protein
MAGHNYYLLAAVPSLGELGSAPPVSPAELLELVEEFPAPRAILATLFLGRDLVLREAFLGGEIEELDGLVVLSSEQARNEAPLPAVLVPPEDGARRIPADAVWDAFFRHAASVAGRTRCSFLRAWVGYEVALRNALTEARAKALDLDPAEYLVAPDLAAGDEDLGTVVNDWAAAANPLAALRVVDTARWAWLVAHDGWFTFRDDELAAYAARVLLLDRWQRLAQAEETGTDRQAQRADTWKEQS